MPFGWRNPTWKRKRKRVLQRRKRGVKKDEAVRGDSFIQLDRVCVVRGIYKGFADLHHYFYVLQPDHVHHLDDPPISGSCHNRGGRRRGSYQHSVFPDFEKDQSGAKGGGQ